MCVVDPPFENVELSLDPTGTRPVSARFSDAPQLKYEHRLRNSQALETFRGTLIDGILQPNVRLGNGLRLSTKPEMLKPQITQKRRARNQEARRRNSTAPLLDKQSPKPLHQSPTPSPRHPTLPTRPATSLPQPHMHPRALDLERREALIARREQDLIKLQQQLLHTMHSAARTDTQPDTKIAHIEARERALEQKEELLRYKRKTWLLEQKLAKAMARTRVSDPQTDMRNVCEETAGKDGARVSELDEGEQRSGYSLENPTPPKALEELRLRIRLPARGTMR